MPDLDDPGGGPGAYRPFGRNLSLLSYFVLGKAPSRSLHDGSVTFCLYQWLVV